MQCQKTKDIIPKGVQDLFRKLQLYFMDPQNTYNFHQHFYKRLKFLMHKENFLDVYNILLGLRGCGENYGLVSHLFIITYFIKWRRMEC